MIWWHITNGANAIDFGRDCLALLLRDIRVVTVATLPWLPCGPTQGQRDAPPNGTATSPLAVSHDQTMPMPIIESETAAEVPFAPANLRKK